MAIVFRVENSYSRLETASLFFIFFVMFVCSFEILSCAFSHINLIRIAGINLTLFEYQFLLLILLLLFLLLSM